MTTPSTAMDAESLDLDEEETLLQTGRVGRRVRHTNPPVFLCTSGHVCCHHGETYKYILEAWATDARNPNAKVPKSPKRCIPERSKDRVKSCCDCFSGQQLLRRHTTPKSEWPVTPDRNELFDFLTRDPNAIRKSINGREQIHAARWAGANGYGDCSLWVRSDGSYVCEHGNTEHKLKKCQTLRNRKKRQGKPYSTPLSDCGCHIHVLKRAGSALSCAQKQKRPHPDTQELDDLHANWFQRL